MNGVTSLMEMPQWVPSLISCWDYGPGEGWGHMMNYGFGYGGIFMWIIFATILGLLIYFFIQNQKRSHTPSPVDGPLDILKKRYAKGEISKDDFDRMKKDL